MNQGPQEQPEVISNSPTLNSSILPNTVPAPPPRQSSITNLAVAMPVTDDSTRDGMVMGEAQEVDPTLLQQEAERKQKEKLCRRVGFCFIVGSILILALSLGIGLGFRQPNSQTMAPSVSPSMSPTGMPTGELDLLLMNVPNYTQVSIQQFGTPQYLAWEWLSSHPNIANLPYWRK